MKSVSPYNGRMRRNAALIGLCLALSLFSARPASAVVNGEPVDPEEFPFVGVVKAAGGSGTGTLIAPDIVLTAAHVVYNGGGKTPLHIRFRLDGQEQVGKGIALVIHPAYRDFGNDVVAAHDIALIKLDSPMPVKPCAWSDEELEPNTALTIVGYGRSETSTLTIVRRRGRMRYLQMYENLVVTGIDPAWNQRTDSGDSGGPFLLKSERGWRVVATVQGVHFGYADALNIADRYDPGEVKRHASLRHNADWLREQVRRLSVLRHDGELRYIEMASKSDDARWGLNPPLTTLQVAALLRSRTPSRHVLEMLQRKGVAEPITRSVEQEWRSAGASDEFLEQVVALSLQPCTFQQVLALVKVRTPPIQILRHVHRRGLLGYLDRDRVRQLLDANASREWIKRLKTLAG